jgi:hypothetical protein
MARQALLMVGLLASMLATLIGCGNSARATPELGTVHGKISLNGKPLPNMLIRFETDETHSSFARSDAEGVYKAMYFVDLEGVKVGPCTARVSFDPSLGIKNVPARYSSESELKFIVNSGHNEYDINMTSN